MFLLESNTATRSAKTQDNAHALDLAWGESARYMSLTPVSVTQHLEFDYVFICSMCYRLTIRDETGPSSVLEINAVKHIPMLGDLQDCHARVSISRIEHRVVVDARFCALV